MKKYVIKILLAIVGVLWVLCNAVGAHKSE